MMRLLFIAALSLLACTRLAAQEKRIYSIKAGESVTDKIPAADIFRYPSFTQGIVYFKSGDQSAALLNYNALVGAVQFLNAGDTLVLDNEETIKLITIGRDTFYFDEGYLELLQGSKKAKLAKKEVIKLANAQRKGAYGQSLASGADTYRGISNGNHVSSLVIQEDMTLAKEPEYFLGNENNRFLPANKKNLIKLFPKQERILLDYLDQNNISFQKEDDLKKLVAYVSSL